MHLGSFTSLSMGWRTWILFDCITLHSYIIIRREGQTNHVADIKYRRALQNVAEIRSTSNRERCERSMWKIYRYWYEIEPEDGAYLLFRRSFGDLEWSTCPALLYRKRGETARYHFCVPRINRFRKAATCENKARCLAVRRFKDHRLIREHVLKPPESTITICIS